MHYKGLHDTTGLTLKNTQQILSIEQNDAVETSDNYARIFP